METPIHTSEAERNQRFQLTLSCTENVIPKAAQLDTAYNKGSKFYYTQNKLQTFYHTLIQKVGES